MGPKDAQDRRLGAIAAAAASVFAEAEYQEVRTEDIAARVSLGDTGDGRSARGSRSAVWVYNEARSRRVLVALAARHAWNEHLGHDPGSRPEGSGTGSGAAPAVPGSVTAATALVGAALLEIARFHRASQFLMRQVGLGIRDIATSEKRKGAAPQPVTWPDSPWGRVAADAMAGRCSAFADHLAPVLLAASRSVTPLAAAEAEAQSRALSDLAFHALLADPDGPLDRISEGIAAYWFERDLVRSAGPWIRDIATAERVVARGRRPASEARAQAAAHGALADALLGTGTLNSRSAQAGSVRVDLLRQVIGDPALDDPALAFADAPARRRTRTVATEPADLRALCDAASRRGLAAQRFGDLTAALASHRLARTVADRHLADHAPEQAESYRLRSDHNLAEAALDLGAVSEAAQLCESVYEQRRRLMEPGSAAAWRRYSLSAELRVRAAVAQGHSTTAVQLAEALVAERRARTSGTDQAAVAAARTALGRALIAAGHPLEARAEVEAAHRQHASAGPAQGYLVLGDVVLLARIALVVDDPEQALRLVPGPEEAAWIGDNVSFRLAATVERLRAVALARLGRFAEAEGGLRDAFERFPAPVSGAADPDLIRLARARAQVLRIAGKADLAYPVLTEALEEDGTLDDGGFTPSTALILRDLAVCADSLGDRDRATAHHAALREGAAGRLDPGHAVLLGADLDQARRLLAASDLEGAARLTAGLLDRTPGAHGRPPLEDGHRLLETARHLAEEIGMPVPRAAEELWDDE